MPEFHHHHTPSPDVPHGPDQAQGPATTPADPLASDATLRDQFAQAALALAGPLGVDDQDDRLAARAYEVADAMLRARAAAQRANAANQARHA